MYLIDAEKAEQDGWVANRNVQREFTTYIEGAKLTDFPRVEEVKVTRCYKCRHFDGQELCERHGFFVGYDLLFFCADGEPRRRVTVRRKKG